MVIAYTCSPYISCKDNTEMDIVEETLHVYEIFDYTRRGLKIYIDKTLPLRYFELLMADINHRIEILNK